MASSRRRDYKNNFDRVNLDKRVDQFFEVSRQFVDGVSGARPGTRKARDFQQFSSKNFKNVGRWVTSKMDEFLEDDYDDGLNNEDWSNNDLNMNSKSFRRQSSESKNINHSIKRPLKAISMRNSGQPILEGQKRFDSSQSFLDEEWPEDSDFKTNKWQRNSEANQEINQTNQFSNSRQSQSRNFPRSRRRRI